MRIYGRTVSIPRYHVGITMWRFDELCATTLGPADYITLASTFHTLILTDVPILTLAHRNEARRFITLLDALYEARCKLLIRAEAGPDDIFFPETNLTMSSGTKRDNIPGSASRGISPLKEATEDDAHDSDALYPETFSEIEQDLTSPFRPNISAYTSPLASASLRRSILADEDSDFGLGHPTTRTTATSTALTGADEKFAYKRARSRLWEMCGRRWWQRSDEGWWKPLPASLRPWESSPSGPVNNISSSIDLDEGASDPDETGSEKELREKERSYSPFRTWQGPPPKFDFVHAWGMVRWGKRAGKWGKGVGAYTETDEESQGKQGRKNGN